MSTFLIPTGDDPEKDSEKNPEKKKASKTESKSSKQEESKPKIEIEVKDKFATPPQKKAIEAIIGKHFDKNREAFKRWAEFRKSIGKRDGELSLNLLSGAFASKVIDKPDDAAKAYRAWLVENTDPWETEMQPLMARVPQEFVLESVRALNYKNVQEITDPAHRDELKGRLEAEYERASAELAAEMEDA
jgi:hypothetical protein